MFGRCPGVRENADSRHIHPSHSISNHLGSMFGAQESVWCETAREGPDTSHPLELLFFFEGDLSRAGGRGLE